MWRLLVLSVAAAAALSQASQDAVRESEAALSSGHPRIYFAEIDAKYSGPIKGIVNGWEKLGKVLSTDDGLWTTSWLGKTLPVKCDAWRW